MIYIRGQRDDYDDWATQWGCTDWRYDDVLPYFMKAEANESLGPAYHGQTGPLPVSENRYRHPLTAAFIRAGQEMGLRYVNDFNGEVQQGIGYYQTTTRNGERASTAQTYLASVRDDAKLKVVTGALAHRIRTDAGRAVAVEFSEGGHAPVSVRVRNEVVVSAGAIGSPKVLMLSGIGPAEQLAALGIDTVAALPVGRNFHDHLHMSVQASIRTPASLYGENTGARAMRHFLQWKCFRSGLLTSNILEGGAFIDTLGTGRPDVQFHFLPLLDNFDNTPGEKPPASEHGMSVKVGHLQPKSRGQVALRSKDPSDLPRIDANFLSDPADLDGQIRAVQAGQDPVGEGAAGAREGNRRACPCRSGRPTGNRAIRAAGHQDRLSPGRHLQDGYGPADVGGRPEDAARSRLLQSARDRLLDLPAGAERQHQRAGNHDRRTRR